MKDLKIQWHPGFVAAMDLELRESRDDLWFEKDIKTSILNMGF